MKLRFIKLPVYYPDMDVIDGCEECLERASSMNVAPQSLCPECVAGSAEGEANGFEWINVDHIKSFNVMDENAVRILFMDGDAFRYELSEEEFLDKLGRFAEIQN